MEVNWNEEQFSKDTKVALQKLLTEIRKDNQYATVVFGVLGNKKRRKQLSQPIYDFLIESDLTIDQLKVIKVPIGDLDENWVGKNEYYRLRLE